MRRPRFSPLRTVWAAAALAGLALPAVGPGARAAAQEAATPPDAIYGATASGAGLIAVFDSEGTGGAFYVSNLSAPFAEATLSSGPSSEAVASYAYDRNAATGLYYIASSSVQQGGGPAFPEIPNTAEARYPGKPDAVSGLEKVPTEIAAGPGTVGAVAAVAHVGATTANSLARSAYADIAGVVSLGAQSATATADVGADSIVSDSRSVVHGVSVGDVLRIGTVVGGSHTEIVGARREARTSLRILDATVNGIPVTIGSDGAHVAGSDVIPGASDVIADINSQVRDALANATCDLRDAGVSPCSISVRLLEPVTSEEAGASASTPGLLITVVIPSVFSPVEVPCAQLPDAIAEGLPPEVPPGVCLNSVPGGTLTLVLGRSEASGSFEPFTLPGPIVTPPVAPVPPLVTTIVEPGTVGDGSGYAGPTPSGSLSAVRRSLPVLGLFGLWQLSAFGSVALAWWRRSPGWGNR